ncbi:MFS transporter [Actinobaculum suis]|uniref:SulP family inorganic anion transporter n=1 Tax=Actinobaculum suis TaxID=1657 RepID=UPI00066FD6F2|nr:SulP family inorganic anion transporter [Actinobaculum suis]KMY22731.1 MFS transporter [Actinobaculum suis]
MKLRKHLLSLLPNITDIREIRQHWKTDILAGITTGIVALPLALAFGVASGVGAAAGLITAIVAGIVGAVFGGSRFQVSGPTGAMVVILAPLVAAYGIGVVPLLSLMAGVLLIVGAVLGLGQVVSLIPWPVIEGFTLGIAFILIFQQIPNALGVEVQAGGNTLLAGFAAIREASYPQAFLPLAVALITALLIYFLDKISPQFPGSLVALAIVTAVAVVAKLPVPTIGEIPNSLPAPHLPPISAEVVTALLPGAISVALLAGIESLLSARVAAGMVPGGTYNPDRELLGQGAANCAVGLFGGMPATGAIVRTAVNVRAGGRSRLSPVIHSLVLVGVVYGAAQIVSVIPLSALAGVLFVTAGRMIPVHSIRQISRSTRTDILVFVLTALITVVFDLIWAILIGVTIATISIMRGLARQSGVRKEYPTKNPRIRTLRIDGAMFFGVADRIEEEITRLDDVWVVILRLSHVGVMDATGAKTLADIVTTLREADNHVLVVGLRTAHEELTESMGLTAAAGGKENFFDNIDDAVTAAEKFCSAK